MATDRQNARRLTLVAGLLAAAAFAALVGGLVFGSCNEPDNQEAVTAPTEAGPGLDGAPGVSPTPQGAQGPE